MKNKIEIFKEPDQTYHFYGLMGFWFSRRNMEDWAGEWPFYNQENSTWFLCLGESNQVKGFCSLFEKNTHYLLDNVYVIPEFRKQKIATELIHVTLFQWNKSKEIRTITDNPVQEKIFKDHGFIFYGNRGKYLKYKKVI